MDDKELDRRLAAFDPARTAPSTLDAAIDDLLMQPLAQRRRRRAWPAVAAAGAALALTGGLAAAVNLDDFYLSVPPFSTLDEGTTRVSTGLPYVPVGETDRGENCKIYLDLGGLTSSQVEAANDYWATADATAFARGVNERLGILPATDVAESDAKRLEILDQLAQPVPGIVWGSAAPGKPWQPGEPHLTSFSTACEDDEDALQR